jgi:hypothetical protein
LPVPPRKVASHWGGAPARRGSDPAFWKFQGRYRRAARSRCRSPSERRGLQPGQMSQCQHAPARFRLARRRCAQPPPQGNLAVTACRRARRRGSPQVAPGIASPLATCTPADHHEGRLGLGRDSILRVERPARRDTPLVTTGGGLAAGQLPLPQGYPALLYFTASGGCRASSSTGGDPAVPCPVARQLSRRAQAGRAHAARLT